MSWASYVAQGADDALKSYGAWEGSRADASFSKYQAAVANNNATIARQNAEYAVAAGGEQAEVAGLQAGQQEGLLKASQGANNIDVNSGSAVAVQSSEKAAGVLNQDTIMNNALLKAYGYNTQATNFTAEAGLDKAQASQDLLSGWLQVGQIQLDRASSIGSSFGSMIGGGGN